MSRLMGRDLQIGDLIMNVYRITYSDGFWADEVAESNASARAKGQDLARGYGLSVVSVRKLR